MLSLLHLLCSLCLDVGANSESEASLGNSFSSPCSYKEPWAGALSRQVCLGMGVAGPESDKPSREPWGLGAGRRLQRAQGVQWGAVSTVTSDFS